MTTKPLPSGIVARTTAYDADPKQLVRREGWNTRFDFGEMEELKASIKLHGVRRALEVMRNADGKLEVRDGDRRLTAVLELIAEGHDVASVPIVLLDKKTDDFTARVFMLTANMGKPFLPLEEAMLFKKMVDEDGKAPAEIAAAVGRSEIFVKDRLVLLTASPETQDAIKSGAVGSTLAAEVINATKGDKEKADALIAEAATGKEGKRAVRRKLSEGKEDKKDAPPPISNADAMAKDGMRDVPARELRELENVVAADLMVELSLLGVLPSEATEFDDEATLKWVLEDDNRAAAFKYGLLLAFRRGQGKAIKTAI